MAEINDKLRCAVKTAYEKKAFNIKVIDISHITNITDFFVILSGNSTAHVMSIADEIEDKLLAKGYKLGHKEGYREGRWILLDFGEVIVHVFHKNDRDFYNLERLWIDGNEVSVKDMIQ